MSHACVFPSFAYTGSPCGHKCDLFIWGVDVPFLSHWLLLGYLLLPGRYDGQLWLFGPWVWPLVTHDTPALLGVSGTMF